VFTAPSLKTIAAILPLEKDETADSILLSLVYYSVPPVIQFNSYVQPFLQSLPIKVTLMVLLPNNVSSARVQVHCLVFVPDPSAGTDQKAIVEFVDETLNELSTHFRGRL
jgi:hypothetical protein